MVFEVEALALTAGLVIGALAVYVVLYRRMWTMADGQARQLFETQRGELEHAFHQAYGAKFEEWKATALRETVKHERANALDTSRVVLKGKIAEQLAPFFPDFLSKYDAADARFLGSPIDYVIFRNLSRDDAAALVEIVFLDVKTGDATLNRNQKRVKAAVDAKRVTFDTLHVDIPTSSGLLDEVDESRMTKV